MKNKNGIGLIIGILLFALVYGIPYFAIYKEYGAVSSGAGITAVILGIAFAIIGGAIEYKMRGKG